MYFLALIIGADFREIIAPYEDSRQDGWRIHAVQLDNDDSKPAVITPLTAAMVLARPHLRLVHAWVDAHEWHDEHEPDFKLSLVQALSRVPPDTTVTLAWLHDP